ncbi:MAG: hypothetical protein DIU78_020280 [Pseudomonadota bacterium]
MIGARARKSLRVVAALLALALLAPPASSRVGEKSRAAQVADAITEIDLARAEALLAETKTETPALAFERARLSIYRGDCDAAMATLARPEIGETKEGASLKALAESCARATVAGFVMEDRERGIWLRLQDDGDRALAPFLFEAAASARDAASRVLGTDLPRPLRIDLVRDLFSLSAVSGLPLTAAETTGTLAVARWGRVIMLSPRATALGYPWQDTLAHEIVHLLITRASRDYAPLWLQEGMAKRLETSFREPRPFDDPGWGDALAYKALTEGRSVGIDRLGPSIAMLPTPDAAAIAFAEVTSFMGHFLERAGEPALKLLLADLRGLSDRSPEPALRSVTGMGLEDWNADWQRSLLAEPPPPLAPQHEGRGASRDTARRARLSDLLLQRGHARSAAEVLAPIVRPEQREASVRVRAARAYLEAGDAAAARAALGTLTEIDGVHGPWFGLRSRFLREDGDAAGAEHAVQIAIAVDPLAEEAACAGMRRPRGSNGSDADLPVAPERRALCEAARERLRR